MVILFEKEIVMDNNYVGTISGKEITEFLKKNIQSFLLMKRSQNL